MLRSPPKSTVRSGGESFMCFNDTRSCRLRSSAWGLVLSRCDVISVIGTPFTVLWKCSYDSVTMNKQFVLSFNHFKVSNLWYCKMPNAAVNRHKAITIRVKTPPNSCSITAILFQSIRVTLLGVHVGCKICTLWFFQCDRTKSKRKLWHLDHPQGTKLGN